jgi:hypothetical protein
VAECICEHSIHMHFMDYGKCQWRQHTPHGDICCDCHLFDKGTDD